MTTFSPGDLVAKAGGDYRFDGVVVAAFKKLSGQERYVVEDDRGILHIFSAANLKERKSLPPHGPSQYGITKVAWFKLPIELRQRWWKETDFNEKAPSSELVEAMIAAMAEIQ